MLTKVFFVTWVYIINFSNGLPADYCNQPFNRSDCGGTPTPVFAYWKPGSRCEIEMWKGCPTLNKFENEMTCSFFCIARLLQSESSEENEISNENSDSCEGTLNTDDCHKIPLSVFTYDPSEKECFKEKWRGCQTDNKFSTKDACEKKCKPAEVQKLTNFMAAQKIIDELLNDTVVEATEPTITAPTEEPPTTLQPTTEKNYNDQLDEADSIRK